MKRRDILQAVADTIETRGFSVEAHLDMTEYLVIRGARSGGIYIAGTNLETWAADFYSNEAALEGGLGDPKRGFVSSLSSAASNPETIALALLSRLQTRGEFPLSIPAKGGAR